MSTPSSPAPASTRLVSLDALRGFDMFWILGADALFTTLAKVFDIAPLRLIADQLEHKEWDGFAFYDLIFPLFVFMAGVSIVFSLNRLIESGGRAAAVKRVLGRGALLFVIALFYAGGLSTKWPDIRVLGVLQRIALAYTGAGLLFCFFRPRALAAIGAAILISYWALLTFVPVRDVAMERSAVPKALGVAKATPEQARQLFESTTKRVTHAYDAGRNLTNHLDYEYLGGRLYDVYWVTLGFLWGLQFPVVKKIWTSSFVLVAGGYSALLLAAFYYMIDVRGWRKWCVPFVWIGMNPITLYLISGIVGYRKLATRLAGGDLAAWLDTTLGRGWGNLGLSIVALTLMFALARFLHRRQIFLRV